MLLPQSVLAIVGTLIAIGDVRRTQGLAVNGSTMALAFMNITTDSSETGFYQIYCVSNSLVTIRLQTLVGVNKYDLISSAKYFFNGTYNYNSLNLVDPVSPSTHNYFNRLGMLMSCDSLVDCFGVKSDRGTTDGFMALPLTKNSKEFYVATWPCSSNYPIFFSGFQMISYQSDTCVEVYAVVNGEFVYKYSGYFDRAFEVILYTSDCQGATAVDRDATGYYVNSTKPIGVIGGHSCAFVPSDAISFCDYMAEQVPPVSELGTEHVVPPIIGRSYLAGYVVRVVAAYPNTVVNWYADDGRTNGKATLLNGQFQQFESYYTDQPTEVICSRPCLVMQYNKGYATIQNDVPTDPMMMNVPALDHFDSVACFATANFDADRNWIVDFDNYVSIVTKGDASTILFDGNAIPVDQWSYTSYGYAYTSFAITAGAHCITVKSGSSTLFAAYCYGHSPLSWSTSAYGYTATFAVHGEVLSDMWQTVQAELAQDAVQTLNASCVQERVFSGSAVATYPTSSVLETVTYPIQLEATVSTPSMTASCRSQYQAALVANLLNLSRLINFLICNRTMCSYLAGSPGSGIPLNTTQQQLYGQYDQVLFVAIDTSSLSSAVKLDFDSTTGAITTIRITVPYTGIMPVTSDSFTKCRTEIRNFLYPFMNWPLGNRLLPTIPNCPAVTTLSPYEFIIRSNVCPTS